jgi:hypothetical protein
MRAPSIRALGLLTAAAGPEGDPPRHAHVMSLGPRQRSGDRYRRTRRECLLAIEAVEAALAEASLGPEAVAGPRTGLVYVTAGAYAASNLAFITGAGERIHFPYTAPAAVPAEVAIEFGLAGPYGIMIGGPPSALEGIHQAATWLDAGACDRVLVLAVEVFEECADLLRRARRLTGPALVETAACLVLEPGRGRLSLTWPPGRAPRPAPRHWACEPLVALGAWRAGLRLGDLVLEGAWRGRHARLTWTDAEPRREGTALGAMA